jgi:transcriptional regulator with XRE-family HTH domain
VESVFYDKFKELCDQRGISCNKAALDMGLSNATPTAWKKRGLTPKADTLAVIASYFGVSVGYLLGEEDIKKQPSVSEGLSLQGVSAEDIKTIKAYLELPEDQRRALAKILGISE